MRCSHTFLRFGCVPIFFAAFVSAQPLSYRIDSITPAPDSGEGGPAAEALLESPVAVAVSPDGTIYFTDSNSIRMVAPNGTTTTVAGSRLGGFAGDGGPAKDARFGGPSGLALGPDGSVYVADTFNHRVRCIAPDGMVTTLAGNGEAGFSGDGGPATVARLNQPLDVAVDAQGGVLISDQFNNRIRRVDPSGTIDTFAGVGGRVPFPKDGTALMDANLWSPRGIDIGPDGTVYVALLVARVVALSEENGTRILLDPERHPFVEFLWSVAVGPDSTIYATSTSGHRVYRFPPASENTVIAGDDSDPGPGGWVPGFAGDGGPASGSLLQQPAGIDVLPDGDVIFADTLNARIRRIDTNGGIGDIDTVVGRGRRFGSREVGQAELFFPQAISAAPNGDLYVVSERNHRIDRIIADSDGNYTRIETIAGNDAPALADDGAPAVQSSIQQPQGVAVDSQGRVFFSEFLAGRIRQIDAGGLLNTFVGEGEQNDVRQPTSLADAALSGPLGIDVDSDGRMLIATNGDLIRIVENGVISLLAGGGGQGSEGDGGPANQAKLANPQTAKFGPDGDIYIADSSNHKVRRIDSSGTINRIAGSTGEGFSGDGGPALNARLNDPSSAIETESGEIVIADRLNNRLRVVTTAAALKPGGEREQSLAVINTLAGDGGIGVTGDDGLSTVASIGRPFDLEPGPDGTIFFTDAFNHVVRRLTPVSPRFTSESLVHSASFTAGAVAPAQIVSLFGEGLATGTAIADSLPLPTELSGATVEVTDSNGVARLCALFFASPGQINYEIPPATAPGAATLTVRKAGRDFLSAPINVEAVAPGLYSANARGEGVAAAQVLRVDGAGNRTVEPVFDASLTPTPIDLGPVSDQVFLLLFGSGIRGFSSSVEVIIGDETIPVLGAAAQGEFVGLDQVNVGPLPRVLLGGGELSLRLSADGRQANVVTVSFR